MLDRHDMGHHFGAEVFAPHPGLTIFARALRSTDSANAFTSLFTCFLTNMTLSDFLTAYPSSYGSWPSSTTPVHGPQSGSPRFRRNTSIHAPGLRLRRTQLPLASFNYATTDFAFPHQTTGSAFSKSDFGAQYRAYIFPCQRLAPALTDNQPMTRGLGGMLILTEQRTFTSNVSPASPGALPVPE